VLDRVTVGGFPAATMISDPRSRTDWFTDYLSTLLQRDTVPAWTPGGTGRAVHRPKLHIVDSGIAFHLLGVDREELSRPGNSAVGSGFESFVAGEVQRQIPLSELRPALHHYRDNSQREIDLILETRDGRIAAIEVKAAVGVDDSDFRHLRWLRDQLGDRFVNGVVCHLGDRTLPAGDRLTSMPATALWS
jgi:uncharacterized protein